jgi:hypothetical protein
VWRERRVYFWTRKREKEAPASARQALPSHNHFISICSVPFFSSLGFPFHPQRLRNAQFLHFELPRRIAQRVIELRDRLPPGLAEKRGGREEGISRSSTGECCLNFPPS